MYRYIGTFIMITGFEHTVSALKPGFNIITLKAMTAREFSTNMFII